MFIYGEVLCIIRNDIPYNAAYVLIQITLFTIVLPFLMTLFDLLTVYNINRSTVVPVVNMA